MISPCNNTGSEILLRSKQICNLSEVVIRPDDDYYSIKRKVRLATILGTLQSTLTNFRYLSSAWKRNCEEERLLGVSLTGIMDNIGTAEGGLTLATLKEYAVEINKEYSQLLGINSSTSITCVKPSGTVSQLVDSASGIHPRYADYYIRRVRSDAKDPITQFMMDQGVPCEVDVTNSTTVVFSFPMKAPKESVKRNDKTAIEQLELWKHYQLTWCEHKPSITVYVREHEWLEVAAWVYSNFDIVSGVSFLPHSDHSYQQAPYEEIDEESYEKMSKAMPVINWEELSNYESDDFTAGIKELACTGGACEL